MKRTLDRSLRLTSFRTDLAALEVLLSSLLAAFQGKPHFNVEVFLPGETLECESLDELRRVPGLPPEITEFRLFISDRSGQTQRSCSIRASRFDRATVYAWDANE